MTILPRCLILALMLASTALGSDSLHSQVNSMPFPSLVRVLPITEQTELPSDSTKSPPVSALPYVDLSKIDVLYFDRDSEAKHKDGLVTKKVQCKQKIEGRENYYRCPDEGFDVMCQNITKSSDGPVGQILWKCSLVNSNSSKYSLLKARVTCDSYDASWNLPHLIVRDSCSVKISVKKAVVHKKRADGLNESPNHRHIRGSPRSLAKPQEASASELTEAPLTESDAKAEQTKILTFIFITTGVVCLLSILFRFYQSKKKTRNHVTTATSVRTTVSARSLRHLEDNPYVDGRSHSIEPIARPPHRNTPEYEPYHLDPRTINQNNMCNKPPRQEYGRNRQSSIHPALAFGAGAATGVAVDRAVRYMTRDNSSPCAIDQPAVTLSHSGINRQILAGPSLMNDDYSVIEYMSDELDYVVADTSFD